MGRKIVRTATLFLLMSLSAPPVLAIPSGGGEWVVEAVTPPLSRIDMDGDSWCALTSGGRILWGDPSGFSEVGTAGLPPGAEVRDVACSGGVIFAAGRYPSPSAPGTWAPLLAAWSEGAWEVVLGHDNLLDVIGSCWGSVGSAVLESVDDGPDGQFFAVGWVENCGSGQPCPLLVLASQTHSWGCSGNLQGCQAGVLPKSVDCDEDGFCLVLAEKSAAGPMHGVGVYSLLTGTSPGPGGSVRTYLIIAPSGASGAHAAADAVAGRAGIGLTSASGGRLAKTENGGMTWRIRSLPGGGVDWTALSCPAVDSCWAAGSGAPSAMYAITIPSGSAHVSSVRTPLSPSTSRVTDLDCSGADCVAAAAGTAPGNSSSGWVLRFQPSSGGGGGGGGGLPGILPGISPALKPGLVLPAFIDPDIILSMSNSTSLSSEMELAPDRGSIPVGQNVTVYGRIEVEDGSSVTGAVNLTISGPTGVWTGQAPIGVNNSFGVRFAPTAVGTWTVVASWPGAEDGSVDGCSASVNVTATEPEELDPVMGSFGLLGNLTPVAPAEPDAESAESVVGGEPAASVLGEGHLLVVGGPLANSQAAELNSLLNISIEFTNEEKTSGRIEVAGDVYEFDDLEFGRVDYGLAAVAEVDGRLVFFAEGFTRFGTRAALMYLASSWTAHPESSYVLIRWFDADGDGRISSGDVFRVLAAG